MATVLENLPQEVKARIDELKAAGNKVFSATIGDQVFVYFGLFRRDWTKMRAGVITAAQKFAQDNKEVLEKEQDAALAMARLDDLEEESLVRFAVLFPVLNDTDLKNMPVSRVRRLRDLIMAASGDNETVSEPVQL